MQFLSALSFAPDARNWMTNSCHPRILHVFDRVCNLINERGEVLSIVTPGIGNGPFSLVVDDSVFFTRYLSLESQISIFPNKLILANLTINTTDAILWSPCPDWEALHARRDNILTQLTYFPTPNSQFPNSLASSLANADLLSSSAVARQLAGLGIGLTPAGDDFILGAVLATWIIHPPEVARFLTKEITDIAAPLTTSLSAAWLRSAGKGETGFLWHQFFDALMLMDVVQIHAAIDQILLVGETSGADALAGFIGTIISFVESETKLCHS